MPAVNLNQHNFKREVLDSEHPVLIDFWAPWCAPCRMMASVVEEIADKGHAVKVAKVNVDEEPELSSHFSVMSIPALIVMKNGKVISHSVGMKSKQAILEMLDA